MEPISDHISGNDDPVTVQRSAELGRYAVAARPIVAGQVLFEELAFAIGPKPHTSVVCLGCCRPLPTAPSAAVRQRCARCGWPLCRPDCDSVHLHRAECALFCQKGARFYEPPAPPPSSLAAAAAGDGTSDGENVACMQLDCITPLRLLLARDSDPERWQREVAPMECHDEARRQRTDTWQADQVNIVGYLHGPCGLRDRYSAELIQRACGILEVNSFEGRTAAGFLVRCIFPRTAVMAHACVPNTMHTIHPGKAFRIQVRATVDIAAGAMLAASYTYTSSGTATRQEHLRAGKFFTCHCARCLDPSELGTNFSSIRCRKCGQPGAMIVSTNPLDPDADWRCRCCAFSTSGAAVEQALALIRREVDAIEELPLGVERLQRSDTFLSQHGHQLLADDHHLLTAVRHSLISMYGRVAGYTLPELSAAQLAHKVALCRRVLAVLDVVHPGMSRARALMLYELHAPMLLLSRAELSAGRLEAAEWRRRLLEAAEMLRVCATVLGWEAANSTVAAVARLARVRRDELLDEVRD